MGDLFTPGEYWTPERARECVARMRQISESPEMTAMMEGIASATESGGDPAALAASMSGVASSKSLQPIDPSACVYRRGRTEDVPALAQLIVAGELPPLFIEEFVQGFVVVDHEGEIVGCGGLEVYDEASGVIRSVVVDERLRGRGVGAKMARLLTEEAQAAGITDLYLFTMHAHPFWQRLGYVDVQLAAWKQAPRVSWQYQFLYRYPEASRGIFVMWRRITPDSADPAA
jgi:N-acetylglutamate synthase-like GNAT family acetyltransferase